MSNFIPHWRASTPDEQETAFRSRLDREENYFAAIREAGDLPWFAVGHPRRAEVVKRLGLPEDISEMDLRRAFFLRRYSRPTQQRTP